MGILKLPASVVWFFTTIGAFIANTFASILYYLANLSTFILIGLGIALTLLSLWFVGAAYVETQPEILAAIDTFYCDTLELRNLLADLTEVWAGLYERLICFWNLFVLFFRSLLQVLIVLFIDCDNWQPFIEEFLLVLRVFFESLLEWLLDPLHAEFNFTIVWVQFGNALTAFETIFECICEDISPLVFFFFDFIRDTQLCCALDRLVNVPIKLFQVVLEILLNNEDQPSFDDFWDTLCEAILCLGQWIDNSQVRFLAQFLPPPVPNFNIGCLASNLICMVIELVKLLFTIVISTIFGNLGDIIDRNPPPFDEFIARLRDLAVCLRRLFSIFDVCLGETIENVVLFGADGLQFIQNVLICFLRIPSENEFLACLSDNVGLLTNALDRLIGSSQRADNHIGQSNDVGGGTIIGGSPNPAGQRTRTQTSLTCLLSKFLGNGVCAREFADLTNSLVDLLLLPINFFLEVINAPAISGNPIGQPLFEDYLKRLLCTITDSFLIIFDTFGHFLQCDRLLNPLGTAVVELTDALDFVIDEMKDFIILVGQLVAQLIIVIMTLFGANPFGNGIGGETGTFVSLFFTFLGEIFDIILALVAGLINFILFPDFPVLFDQEPVDCDQPCTPGTGTFTNCIISFGDCLCGITFQIADEISFLGIHLSDFWPDCGDFNPPDKKRGIYGNHSMFNTTTNYTAFEWFADTFANSSCGPTFEQWRDGAPDPISEVEAAMYLSCVLYVKQSLRAAHAAGAEDPLAVTNSLRINETVKEMGSGLTGLAQYGTMNTLQYLTNPEVVLGDPTAEISYDSLDDILGQRNVTNPLVFRSIFGIRDMITSTSSMFNGVFWQTNLTENTFQNQSMQLAQKSVETVQKGYGLFGLMMKEMYRRNLFTTVYEGVYNTSANLWNYTTTFPGENDAEPTRSLPKRDLHPMPVLTKANILRYRGSLIHKGLMAYYDAWFGSEPFEPKEHVENSCTRIGLNCSETGTGCDISPVFENLPINCHDINELIVGWSMRTNCEDNETAVVFFDDSDCTNQVAALSGTIPDTCIFGTPNNENWLCVIACEACPTNRVFENFACEFLDEVVHRTTFAARRCFGFLEDVDEIPIPTPNVLTHPSFTDVVQPTDPADRTRPPFNTIPPRQFPVACSDLVSPSCCNSEGVKNSTCCCCGDGVVSEGFGEQCDTELPSSIPNGFLCNPALCSLEAIPPPPRPPNCGDGVLQSGEGEECDDGNLRSADGCSSRCQFEKCPTIIEYDNITFAIEQGHTTCIAFGGTSTIIQGPLPATCFAISGASTWIFITCLSGTPLLSTHTNSDCSSAPGTTIMITEPCNIGEPYTSGENFLLLDVPFALAFGSNTVCQADCFLSKRKRSIEIEPEPPQIKIDPRAAVLVPQVKSDKLQTIIFDFAEWIISLFGGEGSSDSALDSLVDFFTNTDINIDLDPSERGLIWYLAFPFTCRSPQNLDCERGYGSVRTVVLFVIVGIPTMLLLGYILPPGLFGIFIMLVMLIVPTIFMGLAYFYAYPGCVPALPECLARDIADIFKSLNTTCIEWPPGYVINPPDGNCTLDCAREFIDCKSLGYFHGIDWLVIRLEVDSPEFMEDFRQSAWFNILTSFTFWDDVFAQWDLQGAPQTIVEEFCTNGLIPIALGQLGLMLLFGLLFVATLIFIIVILLVGCCVMCKAGADVVTEAEDAMDETEKDPEAKQQPF